MKDEYPDEYLGEAGDLSDCPTDDILHGYKMLIEDFGPDDGLVAEMREELVSRHRYLTSDEAGDVGQDWHGADCDTSMYYVSASLIFEVDEALHRHYGELSGILYQKVPIGKSVIDSQTLYQHLIGLQIDWEDAVFGHVDEEIALKVIDTILKAAPNGTT